MGRSLVLDWRSDFLNAWELSGEKPLCLFLLLNNDQLAMHRSVWMFDCV